MKNGLFAITILLLKNFDNAQGFIALNGGYLIE
jgi:hypothetical protein